MVTIASWLGEAEWYQQIYEIDNGDSILSILQMNPKSLYSNVQKYNSCKYIYITSEQNNTQTSNQY